MAVTNLKIVSLLGEAAVHNNMPVPPGLPGAINDSPSPVSKPLTLVMPDPVQKQGWMQAEARNGSKDGAKKGASPREGPASSPSCRSEARKAAVEESLLRHADYEFQGSVWDAAMFIGHHSV